jgi:hypothetical protein
LAEAGSELASAGWLASVLGCVAFVAFWSELDLHPAVYSDAARTSREMGASRRRLIFILFHSPKNFDSSNWIGC